MLSLKWEVAVTGAFFSIFAQCVNLFVSGILLLMLIRAISSFLPLDDDSPFITFVYLMTEPAVIPVRMVVSLFVPIEELPIDICLLISYLLLSFLQTALASF